MKYILLLFLFACSTKKQDYKRAGTDTVWTTAHIALDVVSGEYKTVTAMKIRFDNTKLQKDDSTRVEWFKDSVYKVQLSFPVKDTSGKVIYDSLGHARQQLRWEEINKVLILEDYNRKWDLKLGQ